jgi:hypothetical protein
MKLVEDLIKMSGMVFIEGVHVVVMQVPEWQSDRFIKLGEKEEIPVKTIERDAIVEDDVRVFIIQKLQIMRKKKAKDRDLQEIEYHKYHYYNGTPKISNEEYDKLVRKYKAKLATQKEPREEVNNEEA